MLRIFKRTQITPESFEQSPNFQLTSYPNLILAQEISTVDQGAILP